MFKFLLRILGLDQYEYPEDVAPVKKQTVEEKKAVEEDLTPDSTTDSTQDSTTELSSSTQTESRSASTKPVATKESSKIKAPDTSQAEPVKEINKQASKLTAEQLVDQIPGLKINFARKFIDAGFDCVSKLKAADDNDLVAIKGIGAATVKLVKK